MMRKPAVGGEEEWKQKQRLSLKAVLSGHIKGVLRVTDGWIQGRMWSSGHIGVYPNLDGLLAKKGASVAQLRLRLLAIVL